MAEITRNAARTAAIDRSVSCVHASPAAHPRFRVCAAGRYGGKTHVALCQACPHRQPPAQGDDDDPAGGDDPGDDGTMASPQRRDADATPQHNGRKKKVLLQCFLSPGDIVMLTAAVRDLHRAHGQRFDIAVETSCSQLWDFNPHLAGFNRSVKNYQTIRCEYPLIQQSNQAPYHFIHGYAQDLESKLRVKIPVTEFKGDIHLAPIEKQWMSQVAELGVVGDFWILMAGGKYDFTAKWWNPESYQRVVDHFRDRILFVQCGDAHHWHPPLKGVINLVGKTDLRQFIRLVYHSVGVICPVTFAMHAAAAVPTPSGRPPNRACVVIAGGREPTHWEAYPHHRFLANVGALRCCAHGGCWKSRCQKVGDGDRKDRDGLCEQPVQVTAKLRIPKCMEMIRPADVIRAVESYYADGCLHYRTNAVPENLLTC